MAHGDSPHDNPEIEAEMSYTSDQFYHIVDEELDLDQWQCINCGARANTVQEIEHYPRCKPGDAKKWEQHYKEANDDDYPEA